MTYSTFLLDLDHTLFDSDASESAAFEQTMAAAGIGGAARYADAYRTINLELWAAVERGELRPQQVRTLRFERLVAIEKLDADPSKMADDFVAGLGANGELYTGAYEVIQCLSEQASLALVTNGLSEVQRTRIRRLGIEQYFDAIAISAEIHVAKPKPGIFDHAFEHMGSPDKSTAVMVGDNLSADIRGGAEYGIATCWYNPRRVSDARTDDVHHEIADLKELLSLVAV
jgi:YjjG family noncanonical pyrimidine nucleotidase